MLIVAFLRWWYAPGWAFAFKRLISGRLTNVANFFSIKDLAKTLFAPFRQDSIELKNAPAGLRIQALGENLISRFLGLLIRLSLIAVGLISLIFTLLLGLVLFLAWPLLPLSPLVAIILIQLKVGG